MEMTRTKYCGNCNQWVTPTKGVSIAIAAISLFFFFVPGVIYILWAHGKGGKCPICNSRDWSKPPQSPATQDD